ncbi:MAG: hypothetical protein ACJ73D_11435 [Pyrinomonadaceae bacterium]
MKLAPLLLILTTTVAVLGQPSRAELVDEYGRIGCEDLMARSEVVGQRLKASPSETAVIISYNLPEGKLGWQALLTHRRLIGLFGNDLNANFYRAADNGKPRTEVWVVPPDSSFNTEGLERTFSIPFKPTAKTKVGGSYEQDTCSSEAYRAFLQVLTTTNLKGQIVLVNWRRKDRDKSIARYRAALRTAGLDTGRIRFRYKTAKPTLHDFPEYEEYWLIP